MPKPNSADRHRAGSVQLKAWLPETLRDQFNASCKSQGMPAAVVLRELMEAYISHVNEPPATPSQPESAHASH